jgi:hypothetical protein
MSLLSFVASIVLAIGYPVSEKLGKNNFHEWRAQIMYALQGAQLVGFGDGTQWRIQN